MAVATAAGAHLGSHVLSRSGIRVTLLRKRPGDAYLAGDFIAVAASLAALIILPSASSFLPRLRLALVVTVLGALS